MNVGESYYGQSALNHCALSPTVSKETIKFFLDQGIKVKDAHLYSIYAGNVEVTKMLLNQIKRTEMNPVVNSLIFARHSTPMMVAAKYANPRMVKMLLSRGHSLQIPHAIDCKCSNCVRKDEPEFSKSIRDLQIFQSLTEPEFINSSEPFPLIKCIEYAHLINKRMASDLDLCKDKYKSLIDKMEIYCCDLVNMIREKEELYLFLSQPIDELRLSKEIKYPVS